MGSLAIFLSENRDVIVQCWHDRVRGGLISSAISRSEIVDTLPAFLEEVAAWLADEKDAATITSSAQKHGVERFSVGFDIRTVVREYAMLRDCIIDLLEERRIEVSRREHRRLDEAFSQGTADAVAEYVRQRDLDAERDASRNVAFLAHELRNRLQSAHVALDLLNLGKRPERAIALLRRSLDSLGHDIDQAIVQVKLSSEVVPKPAMVSVLPLITELLEESELSAEERKLELHAEVPADLQVYAERRLVKSALSNLVRNAVKFSRQGGKVIVRGRAADNIVYLEVEDACGGLPEGLVERLGTPFVQLSADKTGFGLGLAISRQVAVAHGGTLTAHSLPDRGCIFVLELPSPPAQHAET